MFRIGIIDDVQSERWDIQVSILDNVDYPDEIEFKEYEIAAKEKENLFDEIRKDIINNTITGLIVDFRLVMASYVVKGEEILRFMHRETPEFPTVIMTNVADESRESDATDADKIYEKKIFLNPGSPETKKLVRNIMINMRKYVESRKKLEGELDAALIELGKDSENTKAFQIVLNIEEELSKYKQMYQTSFSTYLNIDELKKAADMLKTYKELLGE